MPSPLRRHPPARPAARAQRPGKVFPWPPGSDTILIASRPAVQFNPVSPAGLVLLPVPSPPHGPPDKSLFVMPLTRAGYTLCAGLRKEPDEAESVYRDLYTELLP
jgi:hypothetical protein